MIAEVLKRKNLYKACRQVARNKGSAGIDGMPATELPAYLEANRDRIITSVLNHTYVPEAVLGVAIPKGKGKTRLLGIPTVTDRWLQQSVSQVLISKFELNFEDHSYGFRPEKNTHQAVRQALKYINDGYQDIVDIDLKGFFDEVDHMVLLQLIYKRVKCPTTLRLIRKWLRAPISINGRLHKRRKATRPEEYHRAHRSVRYYPTSYWMNWINIWLDKACDMFVMPMISASMLNQKQRPGR